MSFARWEEQVVSSDRGRRLVHYYLRDGGGRRVLAVVGREKSLRHMSYAVTSQFSAVMAAAGAFSPSSALDFAAGGALKWKSRRELVDWLSALVSDSIPCAPLSMGERYSDNEDAEPTTIPIPKALSSGYMRPVSKEFSWIGSPWDCRKKRNHYKSFCRNGIIISVDNFIYIMGEEYRRLVALIEDLYEDTKDNKMVRVRWFHKVDEVGIVLPPDVNDREIFFSLCLQDLSVECIDGLAAVLSARDFERFQSDSRQQFSSWQPHLCRRQIDSGEVKPFDITQLPGYWSQELLQSMPKIPKLKLRLKPKQNDKSSPYESKERNRLIGGDVNKPKSKPSSGSPLLRKELLKQKLMQQQKYIAPGCRVEVLSQDSGVRGCWFRCVVIKRHHDKVKVRYEDVLDADDSGNLVEWVLSSRVASPDKLGVRLCGRPVVRPDPSRICTGSCSFDVGSIVDAWWHDGWWEGIVIGKELEGKLCVYFPGEGQHSVFGLGDLRSSQEWIDNKWNHIKDNQNVINSLLADVEKDKRLALTGDGEVPQASSQMEIDVEAQRESSSPTCKPSPATVEPLLDVDQRASATNILEVSNLDSWKWNSSTKRRRVRELGRRTKRQRCGSGSSTSSSTSQEEAEAASNACSKLLLPKSLAVVDTDNCKIGGSDPMLLTPMALCTNLVMSQ